MNHSLWYEAWSIYKSLIIFYRSVEYLTMVLNIIKHNAAYLDEDVLMRIIEWVVVIPPLKPLILPSHFPFSTLPLSYPSLPLPSLSFDSLPIVLSYPIPFLILISRGCCHTAATSSQLPVTEVYVLSTLLLFALRILFIDFFRVAPCSAVLCCIYNCFKH